MSELANLQIKVESDGTQKAERELKKLESQSAKTEKAAEGVGKGGTKAKKGLKEFETQAGRTEKASNGLERTLKGAGGAIAAYFTVQAAYGVIQTADAFNLLQERVKRLSDSAADGEEKYKALTDIAITSGSDIKETVKLWENLDQTLAEFGKSDAQVLQLTESLLKLGTIGGSSVDDMKFAMRQFGQAMAGGVMRAEEFNSIIENTPEVARTMARGMGMSIGEMRQAMLNGELTSDKVFNSLISQTERINQEFEKMPRTIPQATNALQTNFGNAIAAIDEKAGLSKFWVWVLDSTSDKFAEIAVAVETSDIRTAEADILRLNAQIAKQKELVKNLQQTVDDGGMGAIFATGRLEEESEKLKKLEAGLSGVQEELRAINDLKNEKTQKEESAKADQAKKKAQAELKAKQDASAKALEQLKSQLDSEEKQILDSYNRRRVAIDELVLSEQTVQAAGFENEKALREHYHTENLARLTSENEQILQKNQELLDRKAEQEEAARLAAEEANKTSLQKFIEDAEKNAATFEGMWGNTFNNFTSSFGRATADAIVDGEDFGDAMMGVAQGLAKSMIAALVEIAAQKMVLWGLEKTLGVSAAASNVAAVSSQAATQVAMAGLNAFASTAAIPIVGPAMAPAAAAAATAVASPMAAAAIAAAAGGIAGARSHGGQVMGGSTYLVGEHGPELLTMPGSGAGSITPNHKLNQGGGTVVNIYNENGGQVEQRRSQQGNQEIIDIFIRAYDDHFSRQMDSGQGVAGRMESTYGLNRRL
ncbi:tape measure protein [Endozoicomonas sp. GU-1]|uniref:tape measure protein n=1 Tax=Endozoicomonas sp. GU-1 TaxID=3009078 RepID=UPI0022B3C725|nr:tape measure protein [Endozoicomonas sp. GU-1]WBA79548.1 tape measure protein [Endozoicomonas sp. GU-1]